MVLRANSLKQQSRSSVDPFALQFRYFEIACSRSVSWCQAMKPEELKRYMCAALLKAVVDRLNRVWIPERAKIFRELFPHQLNPGQAVTRLTPAEKATKNTSPGGGGWKLSQLRFT